MATPPTWNEDEAARLRSFHSPAKCPDCEGCTLDIAGCEHLGICCDCFDKRETDDAEGFFGSTCCKGCVR